MSSQEVKRSPEVLDLVYNVRSGLVFGTQNVYWYTIYILDTYKIRSENLKNSFGKSFYFYSHSNSIFICVIKLKLIKGNVYPTLISYNQGQWYILQNNFEFPKGVCFTPSTEGHPVANSRRLLIALKNQCSSIVKVS